MKVVKTSSAIVHRVAKCYDCGWHDENYVQASKRARRHSEQTGHTTVVENGNFYEYRRADGKPGISEKQLSLLGEAH